MAPSVTDNPSGGGEDCDQLDSNGAHQMMTTAFGFSSDDEEDEEDDDMNEFHGYELLPQEPPTTDVEGHQNVPHEAHSPVTTCEEQTEAMTGCQSFEEQEQQLQASIESSVVVQDIPMDQERIDKIKAAMVGFTLPSSSIPPWASVVPEDQWKYLLNEKIGDRGAKDQT